MHWPEPCSGGGGLMACYRRLAGEEAEPWLLRRVPVCASTEPLLARWLQQSARWIIPVPSWLCIRERPPGTRSVWLAPPGELWSVQPCPGGRPVASAGLLGPPCGSHGGCLEQRGLPVRIKWPNDLLVEGRKLAGVLPRLVHRGSQLRQFGSVSG